MSKVFYDKPIIDQIFEEFAKNKVKKDKDKLLNLVERLPPEDVNTQSKYDWTVLIFASWCNYAEIVKLLLEKEGININIQDNCDRTALIYASWCGQTEVVKLLLEKENIDVNIQDSNGETVLMRASWCGHTEIVKLLLEKDNIDIHIQTNNGNTALYYANPEIANLLKNHQKN